MKLSVTYDSSGDGRLATPTEQGRAGLRQSRARAHAQWPRHPNETSKPDDAMLFDLIAQWAPDEATRNRILVDNPATLYGFPKIG